MEFKIDSAFSLVYSLEPSDGPNSVLKNKFSNDPKIVVLQETVGSNSISLASLDLAMSLGVLQHIPDTGLAIKDVSRRIKLGVLSFATCIISLRISRFFTVVYFGLQTRYVG